MPRAALALCGLVAACAGPNRVERSIDRGELPEPSPQSDQQVHADLIRRMLDQGQYYAALAHIQAQSRAGGGGNGEQLRLLEAEARRKLGQTVQAQQLYQGLLNTGYSGQAYHGIGLLLVKSDLPQALGYLRRAVQLRPTDVEMRNDLGYAFMLGRRYPEALPELATAVELDPASDRSRNNLVILMILMRDEAAVQRIARESGIDANTLAGLRKQAQSMAAQASRPLPASANRAG